MRWKPIDTIDLKLKVYAAEGEGGVEVPLPTGSSRSSDLIDYTNPNFLLGGLFSALAPAGLVPPGYSQSGRGLGLNEIEVDTIGVATTRARGAVFDARIELSDRLKLISVSGYDDGLYNQSQTRSEEHTSELQSLMRNSYAVFCLKKKK